MDSYTPACLIIRNMAHGWHCQTVNYRKGKEFAFKMDACHSYLSFKNLIVFLEHWVLAGVFISLSSGMSEMILKL